MRLLTIGAFARATRLSPKALRLYDELGLLPPARTDAASGYRWYHPSQLERARLIAWLRRLGMPLARIREVCDQAPDEAAERIAEYWEQEESVAATRRRLATFLVDYLSGRGEVMSTTSQPDNAAATGTSTATNAGTSTATNAGTNAGTPRDPNTMIGIRYAARSESGLVRTSNDDVAYAGTHLLAVADGVAGHGGSRASEAAVDALKPFAAASVPVGDLLGALSEAVEHASGALRDVARSTPSGDAATTLTAMIRSGSQLALVHIGDSRAYLLRDGKLFQLTQDHTYVRTLVEEGRLTPEEAASHPQRSLLVRALTGTGQARPDLSLHSAEAGDRWLLCSDGLSTVVSEASLLTALSGPGDPGQILDELLELAYAGGAPDNIACVVADVVEL